MVCPVRKIAVPLLSLCVASPVGAQGIGGFIKQKAKEHVERKIVECIDTDLACINKAKADGNEVKVKQTPQPPPPPAASAAPAAVAASGAPDSGAAASALKPGEGAWVNYDFKPGDRPLFVEDFAKEQ